MNFLVKRDQDREDRLRQEDETKRMEFAVRKEELAVRSGILQNEPKL